MTINTILLSGAGNTFHLVGDDVSHISKILAAKLEAKPTNDRLQPDD